MSLEGDKPQEPSLPRNFRRRLMRERRKCLACAGVPGFRSDTGSKTPGLHTHGRTPKGHDHQTGTDFLPDESSTRAVLSRMKGIQYWLRGETSPVEVL